MAEPFTDEQYSKIQHIPIATIHTILNKMHNRSNLLKANRSAYHTFISWYDREPKDTSPPNAKPRYPTAEPATKFPDLRELIRQQKEQQP